MRTKCSQNPSVLTHLLPMHLFSTSRKHQKTVRFSNVFRGYREGALRTNGNKVLDFLTGNCRVKLSKFHFEKFCSLAKPKGENTAQGTSSVFIVNFCLLGNPLHHQRYVQSSNFLNLFKVSENNTQSQQEKRRERLLNCPDRSSHQRCSSK